MKKILFIVQQNCCSCSESTTKVGIDDTTKAQSSNTAGQIKIKQKIIEDSDH